MKARIWVEYPQGTPSLEWPAEKVQMQDTTVVVEVEDLPPSAKIVSLMLEEDAPHAETMLVRWAGVQFNARSIKKA